MSEQTEEEKKAAIIAAAAEVAANLVATTAKKSGLNAGQILALFAVMVGSNMVPNLLQLAPWGSKEALTSLQKSVEALSGIVVDLQKAVEVATATAITVTGKLDLIAATQSDHESRLKALERPKP